MPLPQDVQAGKFIWITMSGVNHTGVIQVNIISIFEGTEVPTEELFTFTADPAAVTTFKFAAPQGDYLFMSIRPKSPNVKSGQLYVNCFMANDDSNALPPLTYFGSGYIGKNHPLTLSAGTGNEDLTSAPYNWLQSISDVTGGNVAFTNTLVFIYVWECMHILYTTVVGGTARKVRVKITDDAGTVVWDHTDPATITANQTTHINFARNHVDQGTGSQDLVLQIPDIQLPEEATVTISFVNQEAGDVASEISFQQFVQTAQN